MNDAEKQIGAASKDVHAAMNLIASILMETSDDWESGRRYLNPEHLS